MALNLRWALCRCNPCSPECGCLAQVGREADPDKGVEAVGVPGIPPLSLPECVAQTDRSLPLLRLV